MKIPTVNYRRITESLPQGLKKTVEPGLKKENLKYHLTHFSIMFMAILLIFLIYYVVSSYLQFIEVKDRHDSAERDLAYWEVISKQHPNFPDGYYNAALYAAMLGQKEKSVDLLERAIALDPEFEEAKELSQQIVNSE